MYDIITVGIIAILAIAIIGPIYSIAQIFSLKKRIGFLEAGLPHDKQNQLRSNATRSAPDSPATSHTTSPTTGPISRPAVSTQPYMKQEPGHLESFFHWLKTDWLMKLGALFVLFAIVWFVRYAIVNGWIGEMGRVALGMIVSGLILSLGFSQFKVRPIPAQVLMALGTTGILVTVFIARSYYDIFTPASAMAIMALAVLMIAVVSIINNSLALGVISFLGGIAAPVLTNSPDQNFIFLNSYLLALDCGIFAMVAMRGWRILLPLALIATGFYSLEAFDAGNLTQTGTQIFMALFYALFFVGISSAVVYTKKITFGDAITMAITVLLGIYWVSEHVPAEWQSIALSVAVVFAAITTALAVKMKAPDKIVYLSLGAAVGLLGAATSFELEGQTLIIVLALEAAAVIALIRYILADTRATTISALLLIVPTVLAIPSFSWSYGAELLNQDFFVLLTVGSVTAFVSAILRGIEDKFHKPSLAAAIVSGCFFVGLIWRSLEAIITANDTAHGAALVIYTLIALVMFFAGLGRQDATLRKFGIIILAGVILRLGFVEIWDMNLTQRTITFVVIGILLITTAFLQRRKQI